MALFGNRTWRDPSNSAKLGPHSCASSHYHKTTAKHLLNVEYYTKFDIPPVGGDWGDGGAKWGQWGQRGQWLCPPVLSMDSSFRPMDFPKAPARAAGGDTAPGHHLSPPLDRGDSMHRAWRGFPGNIPTKNLIPGQVCEAPASQIWEKLSGTAQLWPTQTQALSAPIIYHVLGGIFLSGEIFFTKVTLPEDINNTHLEIPPCMKCW